MARSGKPSTTMLMKGESSYIRPFVTTKKAKRNSINASQMGWADGTRVSQNHLFDMCFISCRKSPAQCKPAKRSMSSKAKKTRIRYAFTALQQQQMLVDVASGTMNT